MVYILDLALQLLVLHQLVSCQEVTREIRNRGGIYEWGALLGCGVVPNPFCSIVNSFINFAAATFFCTYEIVKSSSKSWLPNVSTPYVHMGAACLGELVINIFSY